jgi:hypothetical protein
MRVKKPLVKVVCSTHIALSLLGFTSDIYWLLFLLYRIVQVSKCPSFLAITSGVVTTLPTDSSPRHLSSSMLNLPIQKFQICLYTFSIVLATAAIVLRLLERRYTRTKLQLNDWIMVLAYVHVLALGIAANIGKSKSKYTHEQEMC